jgi:hypothetical protein
MKCIAQRVPTNKFICADPSSFMNMWSVAAGTGCEAALCKWTLHDTNDADGSGDTNVWTRCCKEDPNGLGCPP